jgi:hypothetical protein
MQRRAIIVQAGRRDGMASRRAQDEPRLATSSAVAARRLMTCRPASHRAWAKGFSTSTPSPSWPTPSRATTEVSTRTLPPGQSDPATASAKARSPSRTARSSEPHGSVIRTSSTLCWSVLKASVASATTNRAFGAPPRAAGRAARRDTSRRLLASVSTPMTRAAGSHRAARSTAAPSPVPRSTIVRCERAISWWS